jgi:hypothetical protein
MKIITVSTNSSYMHLEIFPIGERNHHRTVVAGADTPYQKSGAAAAAV